MQKNNILYLKESNKKLINDFFTTEHGKDKIQGSKLEALYNLIQKKGEAIETTEKKLKNIKALNIGGGIYITLVRTSFNNKSFYPCALKSYTFKAK